MRGDRYPPLLSPVFATAGTKSASQTAKKIVRTILGENGLDLAAIVEGNRMPFHDPLTWSRAKRGIIEVPPPICHSRENGRTLFECRRFASEFTRKKTKFSSDSDARISNRVIRLLLRASSIRISFRHPVVRDDFPLPGPP